MVHITILGGWGRTGSNW